jgi:HEAT repeat protein
MRRFIMNTIHRTRRLAGMLVALGLIAVLAMPGAARADDRYDETFARAHRALDEGQTRTAAVDFGRAAELATSEAGRAEALYWRAFSLHRAAGKRDLRQAARDLLTLEKMELAEHLAEETRALAVRVQADLARQGDADAAREVAGMIEDQQDMELKIAALQAMLHMNPQRAVPVLEKIITDRRPGTTELRRQAMFILSQADSDRSVELMIDAARNDPDPEVRQQAVFWLGQTGSDEALAFFRQLIAEEQDPEVLSQVLFVFSQFEAEEANELLRQIAGDPDRDPEVREHAIFGLGTNGTRGDRLFLRELFGQLTDDELREQVLFAVAQHDDPGTGEWLMGIALDDAADLESRKMALFWSGQQGLVATEELSRLYESVSDQEMREQIIFVLSQDGSDEAMQTLMEIARHEEDHELRKQAVFWIGQSGAEGAEDFLFEIINE